MKQIAFNTKCLYTVHGQRIVATLHPDNVVTFHDIDRQVCGYFDLGSADFSQRQIHDVYLHNAYMSGSRAHRDAFYKDSINSLEAFEALGGKSLETK